jgi:ribose transport system substrate-binding protein
MILTACGSSGSAGTSGSVKDVTNTDWYKAAEANVETGIKGTDRPLPSAGPAAQPGKTIWTIVCDASAPGCAGPAAGVEEAAKAIGWDVKTVDGASDPTKYAEGIRAAIAAGVDGLVLDNVDCQAVKQPLQQARAAGIKIFGLASFDCNDQLLSNPSSDALFDAALQYADGQGGGPAAEEFAALAADYAITKTKGQVKAIVVTENDILITQYLQNGFLNELKKCTSCDVVKEVPITLADLVGGKLQDKLSAALTQHPDANVLYANYDAAILLGIGQAAKASNNKDLITIGAEGLEPNLKLIQDENGQTLALGAPTKWEGWAAVDGLNRLFAGEPQVDSGIGNQIIDKDHLPDPLTYEGNFGSDGKPLKDFRANYKKIWGIG